jgi:hypothetical protein
MPCIGRLEYTVTLPSCCAGADVPTLPAISTVTARTALP